MAEIDEQAEAKTGGFEVVVNLCTMFGGQSLDCFDLHDDLAEQNEVRGILPFQSPSLILQSQCRLGHEWQCLHRQFQLQAFLIDGLDEAAAHLLVNLEAGPHDPVALVFVNDFHVFPFRVFRVFRGFLFWFLYSFPSCGFTAPVDAMSSPRIESG